MRPTILTLLTIAFISTANAATREIPLPPRRPADLEAFIKGDKPSNSCPIPENVRKQYCTRSSR